MLRDSQATKDSEMSRIGKKPITLPKGVMTGRQARRENVGGEILCEVW